jgi:hypothetical protein
MPDNARIPRANSETDLLIYNLLSLFASFLHLWGNLAPGAQNTLTDAKDFGTNSESLPLFAASGVCRGRAYG